MISISLNSHNANFLYQKYTFILYLYQDYITIISSCRACAAVVAEDMVAQVYIPTEQPQERNVDTYVFH